jgi:radical SAM protein with 4Fe4S-binding SPASM domain
MGIGLQLLELALRQKLGSGITGDTNSPLVVSYTITKACNLRCSHCHVSAREAMPNELNLQEAMQAIDEMADLGTRALIFSGGEPLLRKNFVLTCAEYCLDAGIIPAILTNGILLNSEVAWELKDAGIMAVGLPIDSIDRATHDKLRQVPGSFDSAVRAIGNCLDVDLEVVVTTMALKSTFEEMPRRLDFIASLGVDEFAVYDLIPVGRGKAMMEEAMTQEQRAKLVRYMQGLQEKTELVFTMSGGQPLYPEVAEEMHKNHGTSAKDLLLKQFWIQEPVGCHAGRAYFSLRPDGDVYPCTFLPITVGNIRKQSIHDIWYNSKILQELRDRKTHLKGECGKCEFRESCGGCRGRAYTCTGDYFESDPSCLRDMMVAEGVNPHAVKRFGWCVG